MIQYSNDSYERPLSANVAQNAESTLGANSLVSESGITIYQHGKAVVRMEGHVHPQSWV